MSIIVKKREGESSGSLIFRFTKRIKQGGIIKEFKTRRFKYRPLSRVKRKRSAIYKHQKKAELEKARKLGLA